MQSGRFAILEHRTSEAVHWDLLLEWGDVLRAWSLAQPPESGCGAIAAIMLPDHRKLYLDYEGPISGDRGEVARWDCGTFTLLGGSDRSLLVELTGGKLSGRVALSCIGKQGWLLKHEG